MKKLPSEPPESLSAEAKLWRKKILAEYNLDDVVGLLLLETAMQAFDRMHEARALILKYGSVTTDRFGQLRANPASTVERDSRAAMLSALKALNLDIEPLHGSVGRPPGK